MTTAGDRPGRDDIDARFQEIIAGFDREWDASVRPGPRTGPAPSAAGTDRPAQERPDAPPAADDHDTSDGSTATPDTPSAGLPVNETLLYPADFEPLRRIEPSIFGPGSPTTRDLDRAADAVARDRHKEFPMSERALRRAQRRAQRQLELELFQEEKLRLQREYEEDPEGWVPPPPPPVPRPRRRTVVSLLLMCIGALVMLSPGWFAVPHDVSLVLGLLCLVGGAILLTRNLRRRHTDPLPDDGAEI